MSMDFSPSDMDNDGIFNMENFADPMMSSIKSDTMDLPLLDDLGDLIMSDYTFDAAMEPAIGPFGNSSGSGSSQGGIGGGPNSSQHLQQQHHQQQQQQFSHQLQHQPPHQQQLYSQQLDMRSGGGVGSEGGFGFGGGRGFGASSSAFGGHQQQQQHQQQHHPSYFGSDMAGPSSGGLGMDPDGSGMGVGVGDSGSGSTTASSTKPMAIPVYGGGGGGYGASLNPRESNFGLSRSAPAGFGFALSRDFQYSETPPSADPHGSRTYFEESGELPETQSPASPSGSGAAGEDGYYRHASVDSKIPHGVSGGGGDSSGKRCACCNCMNTPMWRDGRDGQRLCNACGIRWQKYGICCANCYYVPRKLENNSGVCKRCKAPLPPPAPTRRRVGSVTSMKSHQ
eukprot:m.126384 g.126384  ORF g.126384 m.126384 type:complete len:396 (+) comp16334_c1_seq3:485-1672(+)